MTVRQVLAALLLVPTISLSAMGQDELKPLNPIAPAGPATTTSPYIAPLPGPDAAEAILTITVPTPDAALLFNGTPSDPVGKTRTFVTPLLVKGQPYVYDLTAVVVRGRQTIRFTERVVVWGGETTKVKFESK